MGRTTAEHERFLDRFDDILTFVYLYESEQASGSDLAQLQELAAEVETELSNPANIMLFPGENERRQAICHVLNALQAAASPGTPAPAVATDTAWDGMQSAPDGYALLRAHVEQVDHLASLLVALLTWLGSNLPPQVKPFVTREQVKASLHALRRGCTLAFDGPIHMESMASLAHQEFLAALDRGEVPLSTPGSALKLAREYIRHAERAFIRKRVQDFVNTMVARLGMRARQLCLTIDRAYSWGALWRLPLDGRDCLALYAAVNASGAVHDAKYRPSDTEGASATLAWFISFARVMIPRPEWPEDDERERIFFTSDDTALQIDGKVVQKRALMAIRFDRPLHDIENALGYFRNYLIMQRRRYCANAGEPLNDDENAMVTLRSAWEPAVRSPRAVLHDKSSILGHICALISLEMQRAPAGPALSRKAHVDDIVEVVKQAGFTYSAESVRKACARGATVIATLRARTGAR